MQWNVKKFLPNTYSIFRECSFMCHGMFHIHCMWEFSSFLQVSHPNVIVESPRRPLCGKMSTEDPSQHSDTGRIQCEVLTTLPFCFSCIKKFLGQQSENLQHRRSNDLRKNLNKLHCATGYWLPYSFFKFFLKLLDQQCWRFSEGYLNNFSTKLSSQIFNCCPRNFLIQEERIGNVVSTSHWIRPVSEIDMYIWRRY